MNMRGVVNYCKRNTLKLNTQKQFIEQAKQITSKRR